ARSTSHASGSGRSSRRRCASCGTPRARRNCGRFSTRRSRAPVILSEAKDLRLRKLRSFAALRMTAFIFLLAASCELHAAPAKYHLTLEAHPAAPFPFLSRFGTVTLDVYPAGVRADSFWLNGFSR